jgi:N-acyl-D-amino-acid deacylase
MTSLATERLGIRDRGRIAPGMKADIVVFHPENVCDTATFSDPQRLPEGILHVLVNGRFALRDGKITGETPGRVLRGTA